MNRGSLAGVGAGGGALSGKHNQADIEVLETSRGREGEIAVGTH